MSTSIAPKKHYKALFPISGLSLQNRSAKCPNCETELTPNTVIVSETQESVKTYSCRRCGASLKAEDLSG